MGSTADRLPGPQRRRRPEQPEGDGLPTALAREPWRSRQPGQLPVCGPGCGHLSGPRRAASGLDADDGDPAPIAARSGQNVAGVKVASLTAHGRHVNATGASTPNARRPARRLAAVIRRARRSSAAVGLDRTRRISCGDPCLTRSAVARIKLTGHSCFRKRGMSRPDCVKRRVCLLFPSLRERVRVRGALE